MIFRKALLPLEKGGWEGFWGVHFQNAKLTAGRSQDIWVSLCESCFFQFVAKRLSGGAMEYKEGTFQGAGGLELYCQSWWPENAPRAILAIIHGFGEYSGRYTNVVSQLIPQGYAIYGFDLRGHGRSPGQRGHINSWDEYRPGRMYAKTFLQRDNPTKEPLASRFSCGGHSMGALMRLDYLLHEHPAGLRGAIISGAPRPCRGTAGLQAIPGTDSPSPVTGLAAIASLGLEQPRTSVSRNTEVVKAYEADPLGAWEDHGPLGNRNSSDQDWVRRSGAYSPDSNARRALNSPNGTRTFFEHEHALPDTELRIYAGS